MIADVGIHVLDLARFLMGEVARLSCETQRRNPKSAPRTPRPCCSPTRAARPASSTAATRRGAAPTPSPRR